MGEPEDLSNEVDQEMTVDMFLLNVSVSWPGLLERRNTPLKKLHQKLHNLVKNDFHIKNSNENNKTNLVKNGFAPLDSKEKTWSHRRAGFTNRLLILNH